MGAVSCKKFKPHLLMVLVQVSCTLQFFFAKASFNHGMNPHVYTTYRHFVGGVFMLPFAYFLEKVGLTSNVYFASIKYTSPTFVASMINTVGSLTFLIAVLLRLESVDIRSRRGVAKIVGTLVSLAGLTTMALYKGPAVKSTGGVFIHIKKSTAVHEDWIKGSILTVLCCIVVSSWYIMQAVTLKRYPAQLSRITWLNFVGCAQTAVFTAFVAHKANAWSIGFNIDLWSALYAGIFVTGLLMFAQFWCAKERGPVFVAMFNPLTTILVAVLAYFVLGEKLHVGCIIGGVMVILGLYLLLWGKEADADRIKSKKLSTLPCKEEMDRSQGPSEANDSTKIMQEV